MGFIPSFFFSALKSDEHHLWRTYCGFHPALSSPTPLGESLVNIQRGFILQPAYLAVGQLSRTPIQSVHSSYTNPYADSSGATLLDSVGIGKVQSAYISSQLKVIPLFRYSGTSLNGHSL